MVYAAELDDRRQEIRKGVTGRIRFWPKVASLGGNVAVTGTPTYDLIKPGGSGISTGLVATVSTVGGISLVECDVAAASLDLDMDYVCVITWNDGTDEHVNTVRFDVVTEPWETDISLNDLVDEQADMAQKVGRLAKAQATGRTAEETAAVLATKAWEDIRIKLHKRSEQEILPYVQMRSIINYEELRRVVVAQTMMRVYRAEGGDADGSNALNAKEWRDEAEARLAGMTIVRYSQDEDRVEDTQFSSGFAVIPTRRAHPNDSRFFPFERGTKT